jgi:hypothetical protein
MNERQMYGGSCHCGRIVFELQAQIKGAVECNCSLCRRLGALWLSVPEQDLRIRAGGENLVLYQFGTRTARHYFCRHCGVAPFSRPRLDPARWSVNLRCVEDLDLSKLAIRPFDGENWEEAAQAIEVQDQS